MIFDSLQTVISYYEANDIHYTCDADERRIELGPRVKLGKCAICPYVRCMEIDYKEITQAFLKVVPAAQNPVVAIKYVQEKMRQTLEAVVLSILD